MTYSPETTAIGLPRIENRNKAYIYHQIRVDFCLIMIGVYFAIALLLLTWIPTFLNAMSFHGVEIYR